MVQLTAIPNGKCPQQVITLERQNKKSEKHGESKGTTERSSVLLPASWDVWFYGRNDDLCNPSQGTLEGTHTQ
jgi:hypothetical protein